MLRKNTLVLIIALSVIFLGLNQAKAGIFSDFLKIFKPDISTSSSVKDQNKGEKQAPKKEEVPLYKPVLDYEEAVVKAVESASPSVVSIIVKKDLPIIENCPYNPWSDLPPEFQDFFGGGFSGFYRPCQKGTEKKEVGGGTGFIVSPDGMIVTNKHVVTDMKAEYIVLTNDGKNHEAKVLARDPIQDIAILKINASGLKTAKLGNSDALKLGQTAIAIGNALGEFRNTVSVGVISGLSRNITASGAGFSEQIEGVIQTDAAINQGNSGGPLLNLKGEVIGMNTAVASGAENIGFSIPVNRIKKSIDSVKKTGGIKASYLGVRYVPVTPELAKNQKLSIDYGALLRGSPEGPAIAPKSPAEKTGLLAEDIIFEISGESLKNKSLSSIIQKYGIGDAISLKVKRGGETLTLKVKLEERPDMWENIFVDIFLPD